MAVTVVWIIVVVFLWLNFILMMHKRRLCLSIPFQQTDSMLLDSAVAVTQVYLPLRFTQDSTQYVIHYEQQGLSSPRYNDTLTFVYRSYPYFVSIDCGAMYNFVIDTCRYTRNILDSVSVTVPEITNKNVESIRIFYTVQTQTPDEE